MSQDGLRTRKLCQSPMPDHCCNSGIIRGASPRCFPYTITWTEESTCNAGHGVGTWSPKSYWKAAPARLRHFLLLGVNAHVYRDYATSHPRPYKFDVTGHIVPSKK